MDYREIKIYLHTNLDKSSEKEKKKLFKSTDIEHPDIKSRNGHKEYPSISFLRQYDYSYLTELNYQQRMDFFFNTSSHALLRIAFPNIFKPLSNKKQEYSNPKEYFNEYNKVIKNNIMTMLRVLFLVSPVNSINVTSSYEFVINELSFPKLPTTFGLYNTPENPVYNVDGKKYAFEQVIWMNDILNCPIYEELLPQYRMFLKWKEGELQKINIGIEKNSAQFNRTIKEDSQKLAELTEKLCLEIKKTKKAFAYEFTKFLFYTKLLYRLVLYNIQHISNEKYTEIVEDIFSDIHNVISTHSPDNDITNFYKQIKDKPGNTQLIKEVINKTPYNEFSSKLTELHGDKHNDASEEIKTLFEGIKENVNNTDTKSYSDLLDRKKLLDNLTKKTTDNVNAEYTKMGKKRDPQYYNFVEQYIKNKLSFVNKSSNIILQTLLNLSTDGDARHLFRFLDKVNQYYYENVGNAFAIDDPNRYLLYTGITSIFDENNRSVNEIHVLCDLTDANIKGHLFGKSDCDHRNQIVGKNLETVLTWNNDIIGKNRQRWDVKLRRITLYDAPVSSGPGNVYAQGAVPQRIELSTNTKYTFQEILFPVEQEHLKESGKSYIDEINDFFSTPGLRETNVNYTNENLLEALSSSSAREDRRLVQMIGEFSKNMYQYSQTLRNNILALKGDLTTKITVNESQLENLKNIPGTEMSLEKRKLELENKKCSFFIKLLEKMDELEQKKPRLPARGGKRRGRRTNKKRLFKLRRTQKKL
jgi:hypothetical protein